MTIRSGQFHRLKTNMMRLLLAICCMFVLLTQTAPKTIAQQQPVAVILDTDMGPDYDDVGALALLLADQGEAEIRTPMQIIHPIIIYA